MMERNYLNTADGWRLKPEALERLITSPRFPQDLAANKLHKKIVEDCEEYSVKNNKDVRITRNTIIKILNRSGNRYVSLANIFEVYEVEFKKHGHDKDIEHVTEAQSEVYSLVQATYDDLVWAANLEVEKYGETDAVPFDKLFEWYKVNPHGFFVLKNQTGLIGHIDILPVNPIDFEPYRLGKVVEVELPSTAFLGPDKRADVTVLYVESVIVDIESELERGCAIVEMLRQLLNGALEPICDLQNIKEVCAIAANDWGDNLMLKSLGFKTQRHKHNREDHHNFNSVSFDDLVQQAQKYLQKIH